MFVPYQYRIPKTGMSRAPGYESYTWTRTMQKHRVISNSRIQDFWTLSEKLGKLSCIIGFSKRRHSNRRRRAKILVAAILLLLLLCNRWNVIKVFLIFLYSTSQCKTSKSCAKHSVGFILKKPYPDTRPLFSIRILLCLLHQITKHTAIRAPSITPPISPPIWAGVNLKEPLSEKEHCVSL